MDLLDKYNVNAAFNVSNLSPFYVSDDSRMNPFKERGNYGIHIGVSKDPLSI
uniref:Uncharacterized protein n=1 Tax=Rhizophora mucronata TaxID=61149 RepID=A0A2P2NHW7_RHIMU